MSGVTKWQDATTYSRGDQELVPTCYEIKHGRLRITITCGHIYHRGEWVLHCFAIGIDTKPITVFDLKLTADDNLDDVKARAIEIVEARIDEIRDDMIIIKRVVKDCNTCKYDGTQLVERKCLKCIDFKNYEARE